MNIVTEDEIAESRGRIPAHRFKLQVDFCNHFSSRIRKKIRLKRAMMQLELLHKVWRNLSKHNFYYQVSCGIHLHYYSCDKLSQPVPTYQGNRIDEP